MFERMCIFGQDKALFSKVVDKVEMWASGATLSYTFPL
jgi:hypothetical protein